MRKRKIFEWEEEEEAEEIRVDFFDGALEIKGAPGKIIIPVEGNPDVDWSEEGMRYEVEDLWDALQQFLEELLVPEECFDFEKEKQELTLYFYNATLIYNLKETIINGLRYKIRFTGNRVILGIYGLEFHCRLENAGDYGLDYIRNNMQKIVKRVYG